MKQNTNGFLLIHGYVPFAWLYYRFGKIRAYVLFKHSIWRYRRLESQRLIMYVGDAHPQGRNTILRGLCNDYFRGVSHSEKSCTLREKITTKSQQITKIKNYKYHKY